MAQKMTLAAYLVQRGKKAKALTKGEADLLGIPYPLRAGWPRRHGAIEISEELLEQLAGCVEVARQAAEERARRNSVTKRPSASICAQVKQIAAIPESKAPSAIPGFVLRQARRYRRSKPVHWA